MRFENLPEQHFSQLKNIEDFNNYADGLVLLDDLLCSYDSVPRYPEYLPSGMNIRQAGTPELLSEPIRQCINNITSIDLRSNLKLNFETAQTLYDERGTRQTEIFDFLAELVRQYSEVIHPAVYPDIVG
ncbi:hypothetical protein [Thauera sp.]|uniref:hypothetical protein n=1 Tax=Thauera sp. TaxID=1905334 RepID=UPI002C33F3DB|nr:hypothetical protein [Thauera sp.]HRP25561.1 hypothetical protein [Thauera sp.]